MSEHPLAHANAPSLRTARVVAMVSRHEAIMLGLVAACFALPAAVQCARGVWQWYTIAPVVVAALVIRWQWINWRQAATVELRNDVLHIRERATYSTPIDNVACVLYDGSRLAIQFLDDTRVTLDATSALPPDVKSLPEMLQASQRARGVHVALPGFLVKDMQRLRGALPPLPYTLPPVVEEYEAYFGQLEANVPFPIVTPLLVALNAFVFGAMLATGSDPLSPSGRDLLMWGANFGRLTLHGDGWRIASAMFLHIGALHIGINMLALWQQGPQIEQIFGRVRFAVIYLLAGITGSVASLWWNPEAISAGASGAIFGIIAAFFAWMFLNRALVPRGIFDRVRNNLTPFIGYNVLFGLVYSNIDQAAHLGGALAGILLAILLMRPLNAPRSWPDSVRALLVAIMFSLAIYGVFRRLPRPQRLPVKVAHANPVLHDPWFA